MSYKKNQGNFNSVFRNSANTIQPKICNCIKGLDLINNPICICGLCSSIMKYDYEFQDDMPDTNTIFWDINLQKFRTRSTGKNQDGTSLSRSFNNYSNFNTERKSQNYSANRSINTGGRRQIMLPNLNNTNNGKRELRKDFASNSKINEKDKRLGKNLVNYPNIRQQPRRFEENADINVNPSSYKNSNRSSSNAIHNKGNLNASFPNNRQNIPNQTLKERQNWNLNKEENKESNVSVVKKHGEKTIILIPGQTIEPKNMIETFENPVEEVLQNPDGTRTSLIKQTKIVTITENVPVEDNKMKGGDNKMSMVKQYITYEYKTVTSLKEDGNDSNMGGKEFSGQNASQQLNPNYGDNENLNRNAGMNGNQLNQNGNLGDNQTGGIYGNQGGNTLNEGGYGNYQPNDEELKLKGRNDNPQDEGNNKMNPQNEMNLGNQNYGNPQQGNLNEEINNPQYNQENNLYNRIDDQQNPLRNNPNLNIRGNESNNQGQNLDNNLNNEDINSGLYSEKKNENDDIQNDMNNGLDSANKNKEDMNNLEQSNLDSDMKGDNQGKGQLGNIISQEENNNENDEGVYDKENLNGELSQNNSNGSRKDENDHNEDFEEQLNENEENEETKGNKIDSKLLPEGFKNEDELKQFLEEMNQKGENITPEEKQKRLQCLKDLYNNICKEGKNEEENLNKLAKLLETLNEEEKNEILEELKKDFPKNSKFYEKLSNLVNNKDDENKEEKEEKNLSRGKVKEPGKDESLKNDQKGKDKGKIGEKGGEEEEEGEEEGEKTGEKGKLVGKGGKDGKVGKGGKDGKVGKGGKDGKIGKEGKGGKGEEEGEDEEEREKTGEKGKLGGKSGKEGKSGKKGRGGKVGKGEEGEKVGKGKEGEKGEKDEEEGEKTGEKGKLGGKSGKVGKDGKVGKGGKGGKEEEEGEEEGEKTGEKGKLGGKSGKGGKGGKVGKGGKGGKVGEGEEGEKGEKEESGEKGKKGGKNEKEEKGVLKENEFEDSDLGNKKEATDESNLKDIKKGGKKGTKKGGEKGSEEESKNKSLQNESKNADKKRKIFSLKSGGKQFGKDRKNEAFSNSKKRSSEGERDIINQSEKLGKSNEKILNEKFSGIKSGFNSGYKSDLSDFINIRNIHPFNFDGLFLDISKYRNDNWGKNPFIGPSPYLKFYEERKIKIKEKIINMASGEADDNIELKLEDEKEEKEEKEIKEEKEEKEKDNM